ncbi:MAG TPA: ABC transporter ATP-binding protein [Ardenticatenaceae bacterium]|nr:ABC transporter ATP-binding protein [Ardenticatenaceae bacterium]
MKGVAETTLVSLRAIRRAALLVVRAAPEALWRLVVMSLVFGGGPAVLLWLGKIVIDSIAVTAPRASSLWGWISAAPAPLLAAMIGFVLLNLALDSVENVGSFLISTLRDRVAVHAHQQLLAKVAGFNGIAVFESPRLLNLLVLAEGSISKFQWLVLVLTNLMDGLFVVVPTIALSATIAWWVPLLVFLASMPSVRFQLAHVGRLWGVESGQATTVRKMNAQAEVLMRPAFAKDLRMYGLADYFLQSWKGLFTRLFTEMQVLRRHGTVMTLAWSLLGGLSTGLPYVFVVFQAARGQLTLGDVALFAGLIFQVRRGLYMVIGNLGDLQQISLATSAFFELLDYEETESPENRVVLADREVSASMTDESLPAISLVGVSFTYPGADKPAVHEVNLRIEAGETVVIVGENGAGKTTLAKLLCRLYAPSEGTILLNGRDYRLIDLDSFRREVGVVFQDFARFPATLRENIGFGHLGDLDDDERVRQAASQMGLTGVVKGLPRQLDTPLSKELEDGVELSGGQWQRVAIARALMRSDAKLVILDEPTASLDPRTEFEALSVFRQLVQTKTAVIISHRLALARIATTVVVMEDGKIIERGSHAELMRAGGRYAEMFTRQASSYVDVEPVLLNEQRDHA